MISSGLSRSGGPVWLAKRERQAALGWALPRGGCVASRHVRKAPMRCRACHARPVCRWGVPARGGLVWAAAVDASLM